MSTDPFGNRFRGPTPPPGLDAKVLKAAADRAAKLSAKGSRLSAEAEKSYSKSKNPSEKPVSREQTTMSDNIVFPCPACGTKYSVSPHHAGKKTTCKKCGAAVTVPSPQVANPTIVGGTRTIRRADIEPASTREESVSTGRGEVDMTGGASVMRKEETVIGAPPAVRVSAPSTRVPARRPGTPGPRPAHAGRPMPPGMGPPAKKNNLPLMLGIGGGVVALILVVVIVVAMNSGGSDLPPGNDDGLPQISADEQLLADHKKAYNNVDALTLDQVDAYYKQARERATNPEFKDMQGKWARYLVNKADGASGLRLAEIAMMLDEDKNPSAELLLRKAADQLEGEGKAVIKRKEMTEGGVERWVTDADPTFKKIATRIGWVDYQYPVVMDDCLRYEIEGAAEYRDYYYRSIKPVYRDVKLYPPEVVQKLKGLEAAVLAPWEDLNEKDRKEAEASGKKHGFAKKSRMAWIRFKNANKAGKINREKGQRSFHPTAMGRETEDFDSVWTYTYGPALMVFVEKPLGQSELSDDFLETLESKKSLLGQLVAWFNERLVKKFDLKRVKPKDNAALAQAEDWPMEIVVFKDSATFAKHYFDVNNFELPPGARAYYSPLDQRVMTYDDRDDMDPDTLWFNESVLIHETFHMLSDFYAANPMFERDQMMDRPRYANILVQEGLTDSVAGFSREGLGEEAQYEFMQLNHLRLRFFQEFYEFLGNDVLYRIRDTIECRNYGQCDEKALNRLREVKWKVNPNIILGNARGVYYATACQISYFFEYYKEGGKYPYRDKWWKYIAADYTGDIAVSSWTDNAGVIKFKEIFGIKTDADWDALEKKWIEFTMDLDPADVGKGGDEIKESEDSIMPGFQPPAPDQGGLYPHGGYKAALPSREKKILAA